MNRDKYLGMRSGDLDGKPYAKYWNPEMAPMQNHVQRALTHGAEASELGFALAEANQLLEPGYLSLENGYTRLKNGEIFAAILTKMPGVNGSMIDWWFGWHYMESQRYKLWHPRCHIANGATKMIGDDSNLSDREKYLNNPNFVTEYIGSVEQEITITFSESSTYFDTARFQNSNISTAICGTVGLQKIPVNIGKLIHLIRETEDGCEMRSRFWLGSPSLKGLPTENLVNKIMASKFIAKHAAPLDLGRDMVVHCAMEMNHLASFLADLYSDYHPTE